MTTIVDDTLSDAAESQDAIVAELTRERDVARTVYEDAETRLKAAESKLRGLRREVNARKKPSRSAAKKTD